MAERLIAFAGAKFLGVCLLYVAIAELSLTAPFEKDKCSVDGITPFKTTREEIVERYGEATSIKNFNSKKYEGWQEYRYGSLEGKTSNDWHGKCLNVTFNEKGIVDWVTIVYTD